MERPVWFDAARAANEISLKLAPSQVLACGPGASRLCAALQKHGIYASTDVSSGTNPGPDLVVCLGMEALERVQASAHARTLVASADVEAVLRRTAGLGFSPDIALDLRGFGVPTVLLTRCGQPKSEQELALAAQLAAIRHSINQRDREVEHLRQDLNAVGEALARMDEFMKAHAAYLARTTDGLRDIAESRIWRLLRRAAGLVTAPARLLRRKDNESAEPVDPYSRWIEKYESLTQPATLNALKLRPVISVLLPVYKPVLRDLERAIASVRAQTYNNWELSIALDGETEPGVEPLLSGAGDKRIRVTRLESHGGIAAATTAALIASTGEFAVFLDQDDELAAGALYAVVEAINTHPEADLLYSDEDKIDSQGRRTEPFFKPDWSPDLLLSENYICHLMAARRRLILESGGLRSEYDGSQDHDLLLRLTERTQEIVHIPRVLYHWRMSDGSAAQSTTAKPYAAAAARRAIEDHLKRRGIEGRVESGCAGIRFRVRYSIPAGTRVTIVIPSGGNSDYLRLCLRSIFEKTAFPDYEIVVVDNSAGDSIERLVTSWDAGNQVLRYLDWRSRPFNYSVINNAAARISEAPLLLFLNDDTEALSSDWLEAMVELGARAEVGAVGAKLLYPDGRIQHAGVVLGLYGVCEHAFRHLDSRERHYFDFPDVIRNVSAVTGACMMVRADAFWEAGGFDETRFPTSFNDIDLCLRIGMLGYRILYTPHAVLRHYESVTRRQAGLLDDHTATEIMRAAWKDLIAADPFYSPHLTRSSGNYSIRD